MSFLLLLMSALQQNWRKEQNKFCLEARGRGCGEGGGGSGGEMAQTMYAHTNKWINKWTKKREGFVGLVLLHSFLFGYFFIMNLFLMACEGSKHKPLLTVTEYQYKCLFLFTMLQQIFTIYCCDNSSVFPRAPKFIAAVTERRTDYMGNLTLILVCFGVNSL
jgi:hypothetical protein